MAFHCLRKTVREVTQLARGARFSMRENNVTEMRQFLLAAHCFDYDIY
jgi:hypothetical protein